MAKLIDTDILGDLNVTRDITTSKLITKGSTSGTTTLQATAVAGTTTLTLPAAIDTLVGRDTTDALTNKTVNGISLTNGGSGALTVTGTASISGSNTGDQTISDATITTSDITTNNASTTKHGFFPKLPTPTGLFLKDDLTWAAAGGGFSWNATAAGTTGTGLGLTISNSAGAGVIGESITIGNTQTNASTGLYISPGTSSLGNQAIAIRSQNVNSGLSGASGGVGAGISLNEFNSATQATATNYGISFGTNFNTNSSQLITAINGINENNIGAGYNTGIYLTNNSTKFNPLQTSSNGYTGTGLHISQNGAGGVALDIVGASNVNTTNGLINVTLNNTQSGASVLQKIDMGTSAQANTGLLINNYNANSTAYGIKIDPSTTGTGVGIKFNNVGAAGFIGIDLLNNTITNIKNAIFQGSTSGTTSVLATATAGTTTLTLPAATDTLVGKATTDTLTNKRITKRVSTEASNATPAIASDSYDMHTITALAAAATFGAPTGTPTEGQLIMYRIKDNGTARALSWNAIYRASTDLALPTTTVISKTMYVGFIYNSTDTKWDLLSTISGF